MLRSKGFIWLAASNLLMGGWQQAGNVIRIEGETYWMSEQRELWEDQSEVAKLLYKDLKQANGEEWQCGDRRQELVFIGQGLNHSFIQSRLHQCLLTNAEMVLGPDTWKETLEDPIQMQGPKEEEEEEEEDGEDNEEEGDEDQEEEASTSSMTSAASPKRQKTE